MSAFARPITTRGLSISKILPESGPAMQASERRSHSGSFSRRDSPPLRATAGTW